MNKIDFDNICSLYFSDVTRHQKIKAGEIFLEQGAYNDKLYMVIEGNFRGYVITDDGKQYDMLLASEKTFLGLYSFFSKGFKSMMTVVAETDAEIAYIDYEKANEIDKVQGTDIYAELMPVVVTELYNRMKNSEKVHYEKESALERLVEIKRMASLGQMAAGVAHELNNSVAVVKKNTEWLSENFGKRIKNFSNSGFEVFSEGLSKGRDRSSSEVRNRKRELIKKYKVDRDLAEHLANIGISDEKISDFIKLPLEKVADFYTLWEMGASLYDMNLASTQAAYVVSSVKSLGKQHQSRYEEVDINETILQALTLLRGTLKGVKVEPQLEEIPGIYASSGELVQVWTNIIKNGYESMTEKDLTNGLIWIKSYKVDNKLTVEIGNNGPDIPDDIKKKIFEPNFTTKVDGLSFGLGLGLPIVERVIKSYGGSIKVESGNGNTVFKIELPYGGEL